MTLSKWELNLIKSQFTHLVDLLLGRYLELETYYRMIQKLNNSGMLLKKEAENLKMIQISHQQ